ncbi:MAG: LysR family transcriptional regulator [Polaromonas sp.]
MNVRFLEAFVWVSKLGSFKAAADKLHTTQAGISSRIATLEEQFGVRLFERDRRNVSLTYQGTELLPYAERMIELQARMYSAVGQTESFSGMLRIGAIETVVHTWLPDLLSRFAARYPNVTLELTSDITPRLRDDLLRGTLDCALLSEEITPGFIENRRIANYAMRWATSPTLAQQLPDGPLSFADIAEHPIISFHRESRVYRNIAQSAANCPNLRVSYFSSLAAMIDLTRSGFGIAPLPLAVIQNDVAQGRLVLLDLVPPPSPLPLVASVRMEPASPLAEALVVLAREASEYFTAHSAMNVLES